VLPDYPEATRRALARNLLRNALRLRRGENLLIETWSGTLPWAESLVLEARILGARPLLTVEDEDTFWKSVGEAPSAHIGHAGSHEWAATKACDAFVTLWGPLDTAREEALPSSVQGRIAATDHEWFRLIQKAGVRAIRWDLGRTSELWAKRYSVDLDRWRSELIQAATLDPRPMQRDGARIAEILLGGKSVRITHSNGTDLSLRLVGRKPRVDDGVIDDADVKAGNAVAVIPSGVTSVTVDERFAEGTFHGEGTDGVAFGADYLTQIPLRGGRWTFRGGELTDFSFEKGEAEFRRAYKNLGRGRGRPGLISVGLNPCTTSIPLLFDQERGVITLALGRNAEMGGHNRSPHFVAYQSVRNGSLEVDGIPLVRNGKLVVHR
jgi:leucyl aminopeptidase (aminopeptidase T)